LKNRLIKLLNYFSNDYDKNLLTDNQINEPIKYIMESHTQKFKIRLGLFVIGGIILFVLAIFIIGRQKNLFNPVFNISSKFYNVSGLQVGNNVRFSGINVGTVANIKIINDSTVQVDMYIKQEVWPFIKSDCSVSIGSEGVIGDKLVNILQGSGDSALVKNGQMLKSSEPIETDAIVKSLKNTTDNAEIITEQLAEIMTKINSGHGTIGRLIQDKTLANNLNKTMVNLKNGSKSLDENMTAAKHNILLRGYFKKQAKKKENAKKDAEKLAKKKAEKKEDAKEDAEKKAKKEAEKKDK
jgi:phospholipid/cholesterol/gamma-HCH transport system substrate-binding protein